MKSLCCVLWFCKQLSERVCIHTLPGLTGRPEAYYFIMWMWTQVQWDRLPWTESQNYKRQSLWHLKVILIIPEDKNIVLAFYRHKFSTSSFIFFWHKRFKAPYNSIFLQIHDFQCCIVRNPKNSLRTKKVNKVEELKRINSCVETVIPYSLSVTLPW